MDGLIVDSFAGGGGASTGIEIALGRSPDVAINHDADAIAMHTVNHPDTVHYCANVWHADPMDVVRAAGGPPVGLLWASPDCKHFSKAKGSRPAKRSIRDLAWVVVLWAKRVRPRVICLENVEEFRDWGPVDMDGRPCPDRKGETFDRWVGEIRRLGYKVEWKELRACDFGAPTIRKRLFLVARCDGLPIRWPEPTHGAPDDPDVRAGRLAPWRTAAEIIDWSQPCPSIFDRARPLAEATQLRIARGLKRYVIDAADPFIVPLTHRGDARVYDINDPLRTITTAQRGEMALVSPTLVQTGYGERQGQAPRALDIHKPLGTVVSGGGKHALCTAFLAKHFGGVTGVRADTPLPTVTTRGTQTQLVTSHLLLFKGTCKDGRPITDPLGTVQAEGQHHAEVRAFLMKYYGTGGQLADPRDPAPTVTSKARLGLVTVAGQDYQIVDIGMRMLTPRELFRAQGFPDEYVIDRRPDGSPMTKTAQIRMCGNSVCPPVAAAIVRANAVATEAVAAVA